MRLQGLEAAECPNFKRCVSPQIHNTTSPTHHERLEAAQRNRPCYMQVFNTSLQVHDACNLLSTRAHIAGKPITRMLPHNSD